MSRKGNQKRSRTAASSAAAARARVVEPAPEQASAGEVDSPPAPVATLVETASPPAREDDTPPSAVGDELPGGDDVSVPPVDLDSSFFDPGHSAADSSLEIDTRDPRLALKWTASAARRRAHLTRYVAVAVGLASALCAAAIFKTATARSHGGTAARESTGRAAAAAASKPSSVALNDPTATARAASPPIEAISAPAVAAASPSPGGTAAAAPSPATSDPAPAAGTAVPADNPVAAGTGTGAAALVAPEPSPAGATAAAPAATAQAAPAAAVHETPAPVAPGPPPAGAVAAATPPAASPTPAAPVAPPAAPVAQAPSEGAAVAVQDVRPAAPDPKTAGREKLRSQGALESGRLAEAIAAGERSVAIDPGDAEAWLILGAAYQSKGSFKDATRCFRACVDQANRGPKSECAAMLRQR